MFRWMVLVGVVLALSACTGSTVKLPSAPATAFIAAPASTPAPSTATTLAVTAGPAVTATASPPPTSTDTPTPTPVPSASPSPTPEVPRADHVVVAIFENRAFGQISGSHCCPYLNQQAPLSAWMVQSFAITHPSQPNYLALFSGSTQGVTDDACPPAGAPYGAPNLEQQLIAAGLTFAGYSEGLPKTGSTICNTDVYALKHNPWVDFSNVPDADNRPFSAFPSDYDQLPTLSFVVPNLCNDMHDCSSNAGDAWIKSNLGSYLQWAQTHNSLLIVTFDEDDYYGPNQNQIVTFFEGPMVQPGQYHEHINHYNVLRTLEAMYGLPYAGQAANVATITDIWN